MGLGSLRTVLVVQAMCCTRPDLLIMAFFRSTRCLYSRLNGARKHILQPTLLVFMFVCFRQPSACFLQVVAAPRQHLSALDRVALSFRCLFSPCDHCQHEAHKFRLIGIICRQCRYCSACSHGRVRKFRSPEYWVSGRQGRFTTSRHKRQPTRPQQFDSIENGHAPICRTS